MTFRIVVDNDRCQGHAQCAAKAPEVFVLDDLGYVAITEVEVPEQHVASARRGVKACPERAITIVEDDG